MIIFFLNESVLLFSIIFSKFLLFYSNLFYQPCDWIAYGTNSVSLSVLMLDCKVGSILKSKSQL